MMAKENYEELVTEVEKAADAAADWEGWDWAHDPGGVVTDGPGAVDNWDAWETERREELDESDVLYASQADSIDDLTPEEIEEAKADIARAERDYGEGAQAAADEARDLGDKAVKAAQDGDYTDALDYAEQAAKLEREYGDDPLYNPLVVATRTLFEADRDEEEPE